MVLRVEQGHYDADGAWVFDRLWNGDETDYGLNFIDRPVWLKVTMGQLSLRRAPRSGDEPGRA